jgi:transposase
VYSVRTVKTASDATAVQIVRYSQRKTVVVKHIGSAHSSSELVSLEQIARQWIEKESGQPPLFPREKTRTPSLIPIDKCRYLGFRYALLYEVIHDVFRRLHLDGLDLLLRDLALIRVVQPASKLESLELLSALFGQSYRRADLYRDLPSFVAQKETIERHLGNLARTQFHFDFTFVFYDVTTLFFESSREDELRRNGFSKDNKPNQPQIIIGLIVTPEGFPISYELFEGSRFEGYTFLPALQQFRETHHVDHCTVVADAAMISLDNVKQLVENNLSYIVGARLAHLTSEQTVAVTNGLPRVDGASMRIQTERGLLVCDFSLRRYQKDKRDMEKQVAKAERLLSQRQAVKRTKFIKYEGQTKPTLNHDLIEKNKVLLGIKGYYTNLTDAENQTIIEQYHNLWHVEQAFRIAKSDLAIRPIYHFKRQAIEAHIVICFIALAVCKYLELKTAKSTRQIIKTLKSVTDARLQNQLTCEEIILRSEYTAEVQRILQSLSH